jgi:hypothetical protein
MEIDLILKIYQINRSLYLEIQMLIQSKINY